MISSDEGQMASRVRREQSSLLEALPVDVLGELITVHLDTEATKCLNQTCRSMRAAWVATLTVYHCRGRPEVEHLCPAGAIHLSELHLHASTSSELQHIATLLQRAADSSSRCYRADCLTKVKKLVLDFRCGEPLTVLAACLRGAAELMPHASVLHVYGFEAATALLGSSANISRDTLSLPVGTDWLASITTLQLGPPDGTTAPASDWASLVTRLAELPLLQELRLPVHTCDANHTQWQLIQHLQTLHLDYFQDHSDGRDGVVSELSNCKQLRQLELIGHGHFAFLDLNVSMGQLTQLTELQLTNIKICRASLLGNLPIRKLTLESCVGLYTVSAEPAPLWSQLTELHIRNKICPRLVQHLELPPAAQLRKVTCSYSKAMRVDIPVNSEAGDVVVGYMKAGKVRDVWTHSPHTISLLEAMQKHGYNNLDSLVLSEWCFHSADEVKMIAVMLKGMHLGLLDLSAVELEHKALQDMPSSVTSIRVDLQKVARHRQWLISHAAEIQLQGRKLIHVKDCLVEFVTIPSRSLAQAPMCVPDLCQSL